jgi:desulfoferrodoxin (superoxide reductase-like protein)
MMQKKYKMMIMAAILNAAMINCGKGNSERLQTETPRTPLKEYTKEAPAEWIGLEEEHAPMVTIDNNSPDNVIVRVKFPIKHDPDHYIEKIGLMDKDGNDIVVKKFNSTADYWEARFSIPFIPKGTKAFARCSLHDLWTAPVEKKFTLF